MRPRWKWKTSCVAWDLRSVGCTSNFTGFGYMFKRYLQESNNHGLKTLDADINFSLSMLTNSSSFHFKQPASRYKYLTRYPLYSKGFQLHKDGFFFLSSHLYTVSFQLLKIPFEWCSARNIFLSNWKPYEARNKCGRNPCSQEMILFNKTLSDDGITSQEFTGYITPCLRVLLSLCIRAHMRVSLY